MTDTIKRYKATFNGVDYYTDTTDDEVNYATMCPVTGRIYWMKEPNFKYSFLTQAEQVVIGKVGERVTACHYRDRYAFAVIKVSPSGKQLTIQRVKATLINHPNSDTPDALKVDQGGFMGHVSGEQEYEYELDLNGAVEVFTKRKCGSFKKKGDNTCRLIPGWHEYYDYNY